jgi:photosystem II stability/assembly factor-like uncharacterized protein
MASHSPTTDPVGGHGHPVLRAALFAAAVLLLLLVLTPLADAAARRGMDTGYDCVDVVGGWGWTGSSDGQVIHWPRGSGNVGIYTVGAAYDIHGIDMVTSRIGYLVTYAGPGTRSKVFKTTDGGRHWKVKKTAGVDLLATVRFRSVSLGWVAGRGGVVFKTTNGGRTWVRQRTPTRQTLYWLAFPTDKVGYAVGTNGAIIKTTNGGRTWTRQASGTNAPLYSVDFVGTAVGWACGGEAVGVCLKTTNGGKTWKPIGTALPPLVSVDFATRGTGYAVGNDGAWPKLAGRIFKLTDGGSTWQEQSATVDPAPPDYGLGCLKVLSATEAYTEGQSEASLYTEDGLIWHRAHIAAP